MRILSIDMPGRFEGGYLIASEVAPLELGKIIFKPNSSEKDDYLILAKLLDNNIDLLILEMPFLYSIAKYIGGLKMAASERNIPWWLIGPSRAKKIVFNRGNTTKQEVLAWAKQYLQQRQISINDLTQHQADALLYWVAWTLSKPSN